MTIFSPQVLQQEVLTLRVALVALLTLCFGCAQQPLAGTGAVDMGIPMPINGIAPPFAVPAPTAVPPPASTPPQASPIPPPQAGFESTLSAFSGSRARAIVGGVPDRLSLSKSYSADGASYGMGPQRKPGNANGSSLPSPASPHMGSADEYAARVETLRMNIDELAKLSTDTTPPRVASTQVGSVGVLASMGAAPVAQALAEPSRFPGVMAWNTPPDMLMGQSGEVELRITLDADRIPDMEERIRAMGRTTIEAVNLAKVVLASVESTSFDVSPVGLQRQQIMPGQDTVWIWTIRPREAGTLPLLLRVQSELPGGNVDTPLTRTILVKAVALPAPDMGRQAIDFVANSWDKLLTIVFIPLGIWILKKIRTSRTTTPTAGG